MSALSFNRCNWEPARNRSSTVVGADNELAQRLSWNSYETKQDHSTPCDTHKSRWLDPLPMRCSYFWSFLKLHRFFDLVVPYTYLNITPFANLNSFPTIFHTHSPLENVTIMFTFVIVKLESSNYVSFHLSYIIFWSTDKCVSYYTPRYSISTARVSPSLSQSYATYSWHFMLKDIRG